MDIIIVMTVISLSCIIIIAISCIFRSYWQREDLEQQNIIQKLPNNSMNESISVMPGGVPVGQHQKVVMVMMDPEKAKKTFEI